MRLNLNDNIKVKLTEHGKDIYYHQYDRANAFLGRELCKPSYPKVDEDGYTTFQLWCFMELYGVHMGMTLPNVIEPLDIVFDAPTIEPERKTGQLDNDHIWNALSKVYNMDAVPDEAKSIIGDVMLGLGEQPEPVWHECFYEDPASFPDNERNVLVSFSNFSLSILGQWRVDEDGAGCWYLGDTDETFLSEDLYVDGWWKLPKKPEGRE